MGKVLLAIFMLHNFLVLYLVVANALRATHHLSILLYVCQQERTPVGRTGEAGQSRSR